MAERMKYNFMISCDTCGQQSTQQRWSISRIMFCRPHPGARSRRIDCERALSQAHSMHNLSNPTRANSRISHMFFRLGTEHYRRANYRRPGGGRRNPPLRQRPFRPRDRGNTPQHLNMGTKLGHQVVVIHGHVFWRNSVARWRTTLSTYHFLTLDGFTVMTHARE